MKALAIGFNDQEFDTTKKLIESNISKNELSFFDFEGSLVNKLTTEGPFSYIVINIDNKNFNATKVHEEINDIIGERPFIFIGNSNSVKSQLSNEIVNNDKLNHLVPSPVVPITFNKAQAHAMAWIKNEEFEQSIQDFTREDMKAMRIKTFFLYDQLPYDVYIELAYNKFGKIINKNTFFSHQLLHTYSKKNIKFLYIKKNDHLKSLENSLKNYLILYKTKKIEKTKIVTSHLKTIHFIQEYLKALTVTEEISLLISLLTQSISDYLFANRDFTTHMLELNELNKITFHDAALITAYLSIGIIHEMQWNAEMTKEKLVLAAILQDIHLQNDELIQIRSLNDPLLKNFTEEEQNQFAIHPVKAMEIAKLFQGIVELDFILKEHHEQPNGEGFPSGLNLSQLSTISCIFIISTHFVSKVAALKSNEPNFKEIIGGLRRIYRLGNFKEPIKVLGFLF